MSFSIDIAKLSVDKLNLKRLRKLKFNVPNVELYDKNKDYEFPLVVKPNGLAGSRGVLSRSKNEFNDNINFIKNNYSNSEILIEEMIEGDQISLSILYTKVRFLLLD